MLKCIYVGNIQSTYYHDNRYNYSILRLVSAVNLLCVYLFIVLVKEKDLSCQFYSSKWYYVEITLRRKEKIPN